MQCNPGRIRKLQCKDNVALQVFCIQFYLGTTRLQLEHKGDGLHHHRFTSFANIIVSFGFVCIPIIGWLLDKKGYGVTLGTINAIGVTVSVLQAIPSLRLQVSLSSPYLLCHQWWVPDPLPVSPCLPGCWSKSCLLVQEEAYSQEEYSWLGSCHS